ncbi:sodium/sugar symporter [Flexithrix dorotheae]|uniref:sodium/sugar symporter n=1 Tax=Flexithrix dorotheae TaxID=70993 RepID=UPI000364D9A7|nr:sodium/sugar symporter [Flexithrix dorotheae]
MGFQTTDYVIFTLYCIVIVSIGLWVSRNKKGEEKTANDYFLASNSLTWWAVGASLIAANISAEHFIAMSGSGYAVGLAIAAYEWIAAITLILVAKYLLPIFIEKKIYTMPQFINLRFNRKVSSFFAIFWLLVYVFVNLTSVSYLGALALQNILGVPLIYGIVGLLVFSGIYSIYGGLSSVAWTDVIQVVFLVIGGLITTFLALSAVGHGSVITGFSEIYQGASDHFSMIIERGQSIVPDGSGGFKDTYNDLPGIAVLLGAMWLTNLGYWGFNQYIIQKGLAAKSINEAKKGLIFAGYLKILIPLLVVIPGITAYVLVNNNSPEELALLIGKPISEIGEITKSDEAYPWLLKNFVPPGVRGLAFAALAAAIVSSLASMINSTSTIFTMDIYKEFFNKNASNKELVKVGRIVAIVALIISTSFAPLLNNLDQVFQYIQEYTGFIYPGVVVVFAMGLFWKQMTSKAALWTAILTIPIGIGIKLLFPEIPFILRMGYVFIILCTIASVVSFLDKDIKIKTVTNYAGNSSFLVKIAFLLLGTGIICFIIGILMSTAFSHIGLESIFMMAVLFLMLGIIFYTNARLDHQDPKAIHIGDTQTLFKTTTGFNVAAIGIVATVAILYGIFWQ